jgi:hypothetical protein
MKGGIVEQKYKITTAEVGAGIEKNGCFPWKKRMVKIYFVAFLSFGVIRLPYQ